MGGSAELDVSLGRQMSATFAGTGAVDDPGIFALLYHPSSFGSAANRDMDLG